MSAIPLDALNLCRMMAEPRTKRMPDPARLFDAGRAHDHTRALCYPRRVGTAGERRAARYAFRHLAAAGLRCRRERFAVSFFPAEIGGRMVFAACTVLILLGGFSAARIPPVAAACWAAAGLLVNAPWRIHHFLGDRWPPRTWSQNIVAWLPPAADVAPARIVFTAHYDTKSQLLPTGVRVALVTATTVLSGLLALLALAGSSGLPRMVSLAVIGPPLVLALSALALLVANLSGNRSPGALDNASAVGTLLELARSWRPQPTAPADVVWVATGSEEVQLDGARQLLAAHASWWTEKPTLLINLESVGSGPRLYLSGEPRALGLARSAAQDLGVEPSCLHVLGAGMDHEPFSACGLPAVSILGDVVRRSFALHSRHDNLTIIEIDALERAGAIAAQLAWRWAAMHQPVADGSREAVAAPALAAVRPACSPLG